MPRQEQNHPVALALNRGDAVGDVNAVTHADLECVAKHASAVHARQRRGRGQLAEAQGHELLLVADLNAIHRSDPSASRRHFYGRLPNPLNQPFAGQAVLDEVCDREQAQFVLFGKCDEIRVASHRSIVFHDLADDAGRFQPSESGEID